MGDLTSEGGMSTADERGEWPDNTTLVQDVIEAVTGATWGGVALTKSEAAAALNSLAPAIFAAELSRRVAAMDRDALAALGDALSLAFTFGEGGEKAARAALLRALGVEVSDA